VGVTTSLLIEEKRSGWLNKPLLRKEDRRFLTGQGTYTADLRLPNLTFAAFVRSPYAHARISKIDASKALALPGVLAAITGEEVAQQVDSLQNQLSFPYNQQKDYGIAVGKAKYVGEPVALLVAKDRYTAYDAIELVDVEYEPLTPVLSPQQAAEPGCPLVHDNVPSNVMWQRKFTYGNVEEAFRCADLVVSESFHFHRFTSAPLETNAVLVAYNQSLDSFTIWSNNQRPAHISPMLAKALKIPQSKLRFINPDIGGGFGIKIQSYPYILLLTIASRKIKRPVLWEELRNEHMLASTHGNEVYYTAQIALRKDGTILGYKAKAMHDEGAYMRREPLGAVNFIRHASLIYKFRALQMDVWAVVTNKCPVGPNRCYGKLQQNYLIERLIDSAARQLGMDPIEIRMKNFVSKDEMPYETPTGAVLDGGDYSGLLSKLMKDMDYRSIIEERNRLRCEGRIVGVGIAMGMDSSPVNPAFGRLVNPKSRSSGESEAAWIRINEDGSVIAAVGTSPQGQGHETSSAQIIANVLTIHPDLINLLPGFDMWTHPYTPHSGTYASRFAICAAGAIEGASQKMKEKILRIASYVLGEPRSQLDLKDGVVVSPHDGKSISIKEIAEIAWRDLSRLPKDEEPGLMELFVYRTPLSLPIDDQRGNFALSYSTSGCIAIVEIDRETGAVYLRRIRIVEDSGRIINPMIVEGQIHGQLGHQLGSALFERLKYDEQGQLITSSFMDYLVPTALDFHAKFEVDSYSVPSLFTPLGLRGTAEGGGAPMIACVNAVSDALAPFELKLDDSYMDPNHIFNLLKQRRNA
jgi:CO/xanthine dehydrogenase Mo-binding subunit